MEDFKRFFLRGLAAILPTLITLWLLSWAWEFLWTKIGINLLYAFRLAWYWAGVNHLVPFQTRNFILQETDDTNLLIRIIGVVVSIILIYIVGVLVGNLIGKAFWRVAERAMLRVPLVRAIYPAVKQVTDFVLADSQSHFKFSRVVAVQPHEQNIWSVGLVTGSGVWKLGDKGQEEMVTVFIPSTPTSFSGYVLVVPRSKVVELPMTVEEAFRLLISGGVIAPSVGQTEGRESDRPVQVAPSLPAGATLATPFVESSPAAEFPGK